MPPATLRRFALIHSSTIMTHRDPAAEDGALAIALAAALGFRRGDELSAEEYLQLIRKELSASPLSLLLDQTVAHVMRGVPLEEFLSSLELDRGVSGFINHTVPAAIFCWPSSPCNFRQAVEAVVCAGGDSDSTGAIVGGLVGVTAGVDAIPADWLVGLMEWPRTIEWMMRLGQTLAEQLESNRTRGRSIPLFWPGLILRNLVFLVIVLTHGLRRLLPPY